MNTQLKVGDRVRVISCYDSDCIGKEGFVAFINKSECYVSVRFRQNDSIRKLYVDPLVGLELTLQLIQDTPPTPKWLPIDRDNLPIDRVAVKNGDNQTHYGKLWIYGNRIRVDNDNILNPTHYIPLTDLLNLPIAE